ncbi:MAG: ferrous iron transport protein B [Akkermansiaceae bacterium]|nr:ferrous iron transport protein B [Akkermansiaceae bacterium]
MSTGDEHPIPKVALVGHPNVGKTTLFNQLTGERRKVGNYAGVTVEKISATIYTPHGHQMELVDLPGTYSLTPSSPDERVTRDVLLGDLDGEESPQLVISVVDASSLERHLPLTLQLIELGLPVIVALNQVDRAEAKGLRLNPQVLTDELGVPVVACQATSGKGIVQLKQALRFPLPPASERRWKGNAAVEHAIADLTKQLESQGLERPEAHALQLLGESDYRTQAQPHLSRVAQAAALDVAADLIKQNHNPEEEISALRSQTIRRAISAAAHEMGDEGETFSDKIDRVALHPIGGWTLFAAIMFAIFWSIFRFAEVPMGWVEAGVGFIKDKVGGMLPEGDLNSLLTDGIIEGVGAVVIFLPQILLLFFLIGLLEGSGYMARATFLMDRVMARVGLSGKSFLPLLSGYACAIPGVMATRSISSNKQRLLTILVLPWQSCTARLPVYAILIPLLIPSILGQTTMMFFIYFLGTGTALLVAWLLSKRIGIGEAAPHFLLELPPYRLPDFGYVFRHVIDRGLAFLKKAGSLILGIVIILWALGTYPKAPEGESQFDHSAMGCIGNFLEPVVKPLGWDARLGTATLASFAAREVFVSQVAVSFAIEEDEDDEEAFRDQIRSAIKTSEKPDGSPAYPPLVVLSVLIFYIYALQCLPTTAVVQRETKSWKWALAQLAGMSIFAYLAAFIVYQGGTFLGF